MKHEYMVYAGSGIVTLWGLVHMMPVGSVVAGFGPLTDDERRIVFMTWVSEGLALCFMGVLVFILVATGHLQDQATTVVLRSCAAMLAVTALLAAFTGARTSALPMKACPFVKLTVAVLWLMPTLPCCACAC